MSELTPYLTSALLAAAAFMACFSLDKAWDRIASRYVADLVPLTTALRIDQKRLASMLRLWGIALLGTFLALVAVLGKPLLAVPALYFVYIAPRLYLKSQITRRRTLLRDQMVGAAEALANTSRAGLSLFQGLRSVSREMPEPVASELRGIVSDIHLGLPEATAIRNTKDRLQLESFTLFAAAVLTAMERGGPLTEALERIARSLRENQRLERKMESETASGKRVVKTLTVFPLLFLLLFLLVFPRGTMLLLTTAPGQIILLLVIALAYVSVVWSSRILQLE